MVRLLSITHTCRNTSAPALPLLHVPLRAARAWPQRPRSSRGSGRADRYGRTRATGDSLADSDSSGAQARRATSTCWHSSAIGLVESFRSPLPQLLTVRSGGRNCSSRGRQAISVRAAQLFLSTWSAIGTRLRSSEYLASRLTCGGQNLRLGLPENLRSRS